MATNYVERGEHLTWVNGTTADVSADSVVVVGSLLGIASVDIASANATVNGGFGADASWTKGGTWTIGSGVATRTASGSGVDLSQTVSGLVAGRVYTLTYTVSAVTAGGITAVLGGGTATTSQTATGTYREQIVAGSSDQLLAMRAGATFAGSIDNVTLAPSSEEDAGKGKAGTLDLSGVFVVPKVTGTAWTLGDKLAWDVSAGAFDVQGSYSQGAGDIQDNAVAISGATAATTGQAKLNCDVGTVV